MSLRTSLVGLGTVALSVVILASGCGRKSDAPGASPSSYPLPDPPLVATCDPGIPGGRLVVATFGDPKTYNPITANESSSESIYRHIFGALVGYDWITQSVTPGLAESWSVTSSGKTWTFKLRSGLRWSDGTRLTAEDVLFTWNNVIYNPEIDNVTADLFRIDGKGFVVTKVDDLTIQVVTPEIYAPFLENFGSVPILPKHALAKAVEEKRFAAAYGVGSKPSEIVCSGPFRVKDYKPAEYTLLERNPWFWAVDTNGQRLPYFENIIYTVVPDMNAMALRFLKGESGVFEFVRPDEYERFKTESAKGRFDLLDLGIGLEKGFFWFNQNTNVNPTTGKPIVDPKRLKWFRNQKFRQACAHAVDRESLIKSVYFGRAVASFGFLTPANKKWFNPDVPQYPFDLAKARALLKEIGIEDRNGDGFLEDADGNVIEFVLNTNTGNNTRDKIAVLIQADLKNLGFKVIYQPIEFNTLIDKINNTYDYECVLLGLGGGGLDPSSSMNVILSSGFTHQWFPRQKEPSTEWEARLDYLMNAQLKTLDFAERKKLFDEVQYILAEQCPMIFTVTPYSYAAVINNIGNLRPTPLSYYRVTWNAEELYFTKKPDR